jgi:hypothetical protein
VPRRFPLATLLSWVWIAHTIEADNAFEAASSEQVGRHFRVSLPMWTNGLRFIVEEGITVDELRREARAACNIGGLERWGWISVGDGGGVRRDGYGTHRGVTSDTVLHPTRGDALHDRLLTAVTTMPWSPPEVHPSDGFYTHIVHGDTVDDAPPLVALLGQLLTGLTLDHEKNAAVSLPLSANVLRVIDTGAVATRDLPRLSGLSREAVAMAVGFLKRRGLAVPTPGRAISLTPDGLTALDRYWHWAARSRDLALRGALEAIVAQRDALSVGLVPPAGCWRGEKPYRAQTQRMVADPTGALPWHPMVLHRGAWPDGS